MAKSSLRWDTLLQLTRLLSKGKTVLEDLVFEMESRKNLLALDRGFTKKGKRSPRNHHNQEEPVQISKKPRCLENSRCFEFGESSSGNHLNQEQRVDSLKKPPNPSFKKIAEKKPPKHLLYMDGHMITDNNNNNNFYQSVVPSSLVQRRIIETGGHLEGAVCVIEKALFPTDVDPCQCRLSVPLGQVGARFLFPDEKERLLAGGGIRTTLIQPSLDECEITFGLWVSNTTYVLKNGWNDVWKDNELRVGTVVRLWAFRRKSSDDSLCFALEKRS